MKNCSNWRVEEGCQLCSEPRHARYVPSAEDSVIATLTHVNKQLTKWLIRETQSRPHLQTAAPDGLRALEPHFSPLFLGLMRHILCWKNIFLLGIYFEQCFSNNV